MCFSLLKTYCTINGIYRQPFGAPRQNRTAITGLQNQCNAIILVGRVCSRLCDSLLNVLFVFNCTLNLGTMFFTCWFQQFGQLFYCQWTKSGLASLVFHWVVAGSKCWHSFSFFYLAPQRGIEPRTNWLTANYSTAELLGNVLWRCDWDSNSEPGLRRATD